VENGNFTPGELHDIVDQLYEVSDREICRILAMYLNNDEETEDE